MANIQPFNYQESTNIEEHNQIVNKVNEIVQVINDVNLDTINSEIANLKTKATETDTEIVAIKNKDTTQDTEINGITKNLVSNVTATFDNPSRELKISLGREVSPSIDATVVIPASSETGQYSAGNGISIQNYQIAVDTNVVALKTDIPVVPDVTNLTQRVTILETEMPTKASVDDVNSKVAIAQGTENAGKVLGIGVDGNVTPVNAGGGSGGADGWEEIDINNWPTDWVSGDKVKIIPYIGYYGVSATSWTSTISTELPPIFGIRESTPIEVEIRDNADTMFFIIGGRLSSVYVQLWSLQVTPSTSVFNNTNAYIVNTLGMYFNGANSDLVYNFSINVGSEAGRTSFKEKIKAIYRKRASA